MATTTPGCLWSVPGRSRGMLKRVTMYTWLSVSCRTSHVAGWMNAATEQWLTRYVLVIENIQRMC